MSDIYEADLLHRLQNSRDLQAHKEAILLLMGCVKTLEEKVSALEIFHGGQGDIMAPISVPEGFKPRRGRPRKAPSD